MILQYGRAPGEFLVFTLLTLSTGSTCPNLKCTCTFVSVRLIFGIWPQTDALNLKTSILQVKMSSFVHTKVWSPKLWQSVQTDDPVHCFGG